MKSGAIILCIVVGIQAVFSQDIHWSQYDHNPVLLNPGNVGSFNGDYRFHLNYRSQWKSVTVPYSTFSVSVEAKNLYKNFSVGTYIMHDVAGDGKMRTVDVLPSVAYTLKLTEDSIHLLRPGVQFGINSRSLNPGAFTYDNQWNGQKFDKNIPINETFQKKSRTHFTIGVGVTYEYRKSKRKKFIAGIGLFNLTRPNQSFFGAKIHRDLRFNLFAKSEYKVGFDWDILPSIRLSLQGKYKEFTLGSQVRYILQDRLGVYRALLAGLYVRTGDAFYISAGMEYQNWWLGFSYDINTSTLTPASRYRGGFELSLRYIFAKFKPKIVKHRACPDYI